MTRRTLRLTPRPADGRRSSLRRMGALLAATGLLSLTACGFTPIYGQGPGSAPLEDVSVQLSEHSRAGFLLQERLNDALGRHADKASWVLDLDVVKHRIASGVRVNNVASRYELSLTVGLVLKDARTGKVALKDTVVALSSYDSADQPYAGLAAEQDGESRAAAVAADLVRLRLARYFATHPTP